MQKILDGFSSPADLGVAEAAEQLGSGSLTSAELLDACLARIDERNGEEPTQTGSPDTVNAWAHLYPAEARAQARAADERRAATGGSSPMLGIPVGLKDLYGAKGRPLTASSRVLAGNIAEVDSAVWEQLAGDGAVLVGHTHTHEFAAGGTTDQVGNPWNLANSAGGSSGGSAAALAAGMVPAALGTDTAGSLRIPAALCGVSAVKPTLGRVSLDGVLPLAYSLDHAGPMARSIADCRIILGSIERARQRATPWRGSGAGAAPLDAVRFVDSALPLQGLRVAVTNRTESTSVHPDILEGLSDARALLEDLGATIVELEAPSGFDGSHFDTILMAEARSFHSRHIARQELFHGSTRQFLAFAGEPLTAHEYVDAQVRRAEATQEWQAWFSAHTIHALLEPTTAVVAPTRGHGYDPDQAVGDNDPLTYFTATWNVTGFPAAALPAGIGATSGLPVGVSLISTLGQDDLVLTIGEALQRRGLAPLGIAPVDRQAVNIGRSHGLSGGRHG